MAYFLNPSALSAVFTVPCSVADKYLKIATPNQIKVLLFALRNISSGISPEAAAAALGISSQEADDALIFWVQCEVLGSDSAGKTESAQNKVVIKSEMPTRADVTRRGLEDERIKLLLREAQLKFQRNLKYNESSLLVSLFDDCGMDVSVILMLLQFAESEGKCNVSFIKSTAARWLKSGVQNVAEAEKIIQADAEKRLAWRVVERVFGIESRKPSEKELELSNLWLNEYKIGEEMLKQAYDACINQKAKISFPYIAKIIEVWHKKGVDTPQKAAAQAAAKSARAKNDYAGYDLDLFEKMLEED